MHKITAFNKIIGHTKIFKLNTPPKIIMLWKIHNGDIERMDCNWCTKRYQHQRDNSPSPSLHMLFIGLLIFSRAVFTILTPIVSFQLQNKTLLQQPNFNSSFSRVVLKAERYHAQGSSPMQFHFFLSFQQGNVQCSGLIIFLSSVRQKGKKAKLQLFPELTWKRQ